MIDDEYPTLNGFLNETLTAPQKKPLNQERLQKIIDMCHQNHSWSVDVYDGKVPKLGEQNQDGYPKHINHSDLIILDYHLDGEPDVDDGKRARAIINQLAKNNHFNLVIIQSKGHDDSIENIFKDVLKEFLHRDCFDIRVEKEVKEAITTFLDEEDPEGTDFTNFKSSPELLDFLLTLRDPVKREDFEDKDHFLYSARDEIKTIAQGSKQAELGVVRYRILELLKENLAEASKNGSGKNVDWYYKADSINYIATDRVFLTVALKKKDDTGEQLHQTLVEALQNQNPSPMMLLMAKMRHEINSKGVEQASQIVTNRPAQAGWLYRLLEESPTDTSAHSHAINLHWEQLSAASKEPLVDFSDRLVKSLQVEGTESEGIVQQFFEECIDNDEASLNHLNVYSCSRQPTTSHLTTGTIFQCEEKDYWICLSPSCDLVPGQRLQIWEDRVGKDYLPFQTIRLFPDTRNLKNILKKVNDNEHIFLNLDDEIMHLKFAKGKENPTWETMYAEDQGRFDTQVTPPTLSVKTLRFQNDSLDSKQITMKIVAELRYEYALNLLQKFGSNQSRIGLNFTKQLWQK